MSRVNKKDLLLKAAEQIVTEQGVHELTLDAVAKRADVSKGGLLYHFPSKEALIEGMMEHLLGECNALIQHEMEAEKVNGKFPEKGRWLRAYVRVCTTVQSDDSPATRALLGLSFTEVRYIPVIEGMYSDWLKRGHQDGISRETAELVLVAADGCWLYGLYHPESSAARLLALRETMLDLIARDIASQGGG